jgi:parallel beta-helix repeat protein
MNLAVESRPGLQRWVLGLSVLLGLARPAHAVDGVIEINQARALAGRVTATDGPGFPVTIDQRGSYRLTGDLRLSDPDVDAIHLQSGVSNVTLDLNGFALVGPTACSGTPLSCMPNGTGIGIAGTSANENVTVLNGTVRGFARQGINLSRGARVERVRAISNGSGGIVTSHDCTLVGNAALSNGSNGIDGRDRCLVTGNTANGNGEAGISGIDQCLMTGNTANGNGSLGILGGDGNTVTGNTADSNGGRGIQVGFGSTVIGNTARDNASNGLSITGGGYGHNVLTDNADGRDNSQVVGTERVEIAPNVCGSSLCP